MQMNFVYEPNASRVVFGVGAAKQVRDEVAKLGSRALILSTAFQRSDAERLAQDLGTLSAGVFAEAAMHTPVNVTEKALAAFQESGADCIVSIGGGSTIGLGKAIAYRNDAPQIVLATTYAGSEVTPILGQTENGLKTTVRDATILPEVVIYDPELTVGLPVQMSVTSGLNAMAHAVEGLYAQDRNPVSSLMAVDALRALQAALPVIVSEPTNIDARSRALYGSWLCGTVLGSVGMALHHKICHTLGGSFDLPHAETHAIMLPHTAAFNAVAADEFLRPVAEIFGGSVGGGLHSFAVQLGAPTALRDLGLKESDLERAAELATTNAYWNPRPVEKNAVRDMLSRAWEGSPPE
ncbi:maleylacetate reductase [Pelagibacterium sp.]|uniref:maleylacetate reductase n=1 Tax=Pelagibacterium sp. TaxID=1967288 RepID=UPI003A8EABCF